MIDMAENIIFYGPPGTGKTYLLQKMMSDYIDYQVSDDQIRQAFFSYSEPWVLITLVMLQHHGRMNPVETQKKIDSLKLGRTVSAASELEAHNMKASPIGMPRTAPYVFFECGDGSWYVDRIRVQQTIADFYDRFLKDSHVDSRYAFVTFHQSFSYEDFIEGIRPEYVKETNSIDYSPKPGVFKALCRKAAQHPEKKYAVFIDEINRGNIAEIFGELISLIEIDKRKGMANELSVTLPYSKETFVVPNNVNIIGTMNSADRSIGTIDVALRRRFDFRSMNPDFNVIEEELRLNDVDAHDVDGVDLISLFNTMNSRIELLMDRNHMIGHALFLKVRSGKDIVNVIQEKVVPLLEEYFFNDLQKIQLVFNDLDEDGGMREDAVYRDETLSVDHYFDYIGDYMLEDKKHYFINKNLQPSDLLHIYGKTT